MNGTFLYLIASCVFLTCGFGNSVFAQDPGAQNHAGTIQFQDPPDPAWLKLFNSVSPDEKAYFKPLEKTMAEICDVVINVPSLHPLKGFNIQPYVSSSNGEQSFKHYPIPLMDITFCNYVFYTDKRTRRIKQSGVWGSSIRIFMNDPQWLLETDNNILDHCDSLHIPYFYYRPVMHTDANGYWIIRPYKVLTEIRVIKKKNMPLYIPVTQKEYLKYKLELKKRSLASDHEMLSDSKRRLRNLKYPQNESWIEQDIKDENRNIEDDTKAIRDYQQALSTWPEQKLDEPAYTSIYYIPKRAQNQVDLVTAGYKGAREFVRLNMAYFDKTLPGGTPQLIMIGAQDDPHFCEPYMAREVHNWFNQIDYGKLQAMIR